MRTECTGAYTEYGSFELRREDGSLYRKIDPDQVFQVGNSIGGFWAKPITYTGQRMIALVRVGGSNVGQPVERIRRRFGQERGMLLQPGLGLWADTSGAARRGVWHRIREDTDPIRRALRSVGLPSSMLQIVDKIDLEVAEGGRRDRGGADWKWFIADGSVSHLRVETHTGYYKWDTTYDRVENGTLLITGTDWSSEDCNFARPTLQKVLVTPMVNRELVAKIILAVREKLDRKENLLAIEEQYRTSVLKMPKAYWF